MSRMCEDNRDASSRAVKEFLSFAQSMQGTELMIFEAKLVGVEARLSTVTTKCGMR